MVKLGFFTQNVQSSWSSIMYAGLWAIPIQLKVYDDSDTINQAFVTYSRAVRVLF